MKTTKILIMIRSAPRPVGEAGVLTNRKKHRAVRSAPSEQSDNVFDREQDLKGAVYE